ncbi:MAG: alpha/beta fold hydrolase [Kribbellaceae bacterium]
MTQFVRTTYLEIGFEEAGTADRPVAVLLHGWPDDVHCWDGVIPSLTDRYRLLMPHLRGHGATTFREKETPRSGQTAALAHDLLEFVRGLDLAEVLLVGHDWGARAGYAAAAVEPGLFRGLVAMSAGYASTDPDQAIGYELAQAYWYQWFVATQIGRRAFEEDRRGICRYLWRTWSPTWDFDGEEFDEAAEAWDNSDFAEVTANAYLQRWGEEPGSLEYDELDKQFAEQPEIAVPTMVLHGEQDRGDLPQTTADQERHFTAGYERRLLPGVGHFVPREAPAHTAAAIRDRDSG